MNIEFRLNEIHSVFTPRESLHAGFLLWRIALSYVRAALHLQGMAIVAAVANLFPRWRDRP